MLLFCINGYPNVKNLQIYNNYTGKENYENQKEYGERIFREIEDFAEGGVDINDIHHDILLVCTCDWKASACIEGNT